MTRRFLAAVGVAATCAFIAVASLPLAGQGSGKPAPPLVITAYNGGPPIAYTVPKTPWGDPDLQGTWSSDDAQFGRAGGAAGGGGRGGPRGGGAPGAPAAPGARAGGGAGPAAAPATPQPLYLSDEDFAAHQKTIAAGVARSEGADSVSTFRSDFARRAFRQTRIIVDPPNGVQPAVTPEGEKRRSPVRDRGTFGEGPFNSPEDFTLYDRCITRGIWGSVMRVVYGNGNRIVQAPGMVVISYEMIHDSRVIYTDGRPHINTGIRQYLGDSRGHWEGEELVVETTNLTDKTSIGLNGNGLRHSDKMKITERFKRVAADIVQYQITIDDPVTYTAPFTASLPLTPLDGGVLLPYECHEGNHAVLQSLGAERAEDAAIAADLAKGIKRERRGVQENASVQGGGGGGRGARGAGAGAGRGGAPAGPPPEGDIDR